MSSSLFIQYLFSALTSGGIYAMVGIGFVIVYRISKILNIAQGHLYVLSAFLAMTMIDSWEVSRWFSIPLVVAAVCTIMVILHRLTMHPIRNKDMLSKLLMTVGWVFIIEGSLEWIYGPTPRSLSAFPGPKVLNFQDAAISFQSIWVLGAAIVSSILLYVFLTRTTIGRAMEACSENETGSKLVGIHVEKMLILAFIVCAMFGAVAGIVGGPLSYVTYAAGMGLTIKGLTAAIVGGINHIYGALVGGVVLGLLEAFSAGLISTLFYELVSILALLIILVARPQGILGGR
ncbi:branched-chain amino acid ABC transporter permease [Paenibacillus validus]|uniref:Branched-chain amino acid ABC transporter permease n=1 Tax=Paenibacillus validus TaxID=44253 RepID=A0A7X2Z7S6_9BACL|nr:MULTISPECIES: branched-chain amino acid ABC transporter permease [Paenibacillus]MED4600626.1 branched-chain amino acid ABC transporter permease [Paenibacillus validus]MED4606259.1 branched-chain amino acid ABC transporter permease [Paenibacillus validus]MUG69915.1 hypothetical protein [Paenibacillus validus]